MDAHMSCLHTYKHWLATDTSEGEAWCYGCSACGKNALAYIKQNRLVGPSIIIRTNKMFLFDNHCVRLISELKWDEKNLALFLHPEPYVILFFYTMYL